MGAHGRVRSAQAGSAGAVSRSGGRSVPRKLRTAAQLTSGFGAGYESLTCSMPFKKYQALTGKTPETQELA